MLDHVTGRDSAFINRSRLEPCGWVALWQAAKVLVFSTFRKVNSQQACVGMNVRPIF